MYNLVCEEFMSMGGVYVKFLQGVLLRSKVMKKWHNPEKLKIFEDLDYEPLNIATVLQYELSKEKLAQIATVQPQPFAAGSFGQVYFAQLKSGQNVIIKVLRPFIRETLRHDIKLLTRFSKSFFSKLYKNMNIQLDDAMKEFTESTLRETDYAHEAEFANEMYIHYKDHPNLVIPHTYLDLCTDNIIVQDYIDGISVAHVIKLHEQGVDPKEYVMETLGSDIVTQLKIFGFESIIGIFDMPRIQGDPHPGNIRLMSNNRVGLIDFGISATAPEDKSGLYGLLETYDKVFKGSQTAVGLFEYGLKFFVSDLYRSLRRIGEYLGSRENKDYVSGVSEVAGKVFADATGTDIVAMDLTKDANVLVEINKLVNKGNRFGLVMKLEATEILRAIQTYTTMCTSLGLYHEILPDIIEASVKYIETNYPDQIRENSRQMPLATAIENVSNWLERVANKDPVLFGQLSEKISAARQQELSMVTEESNNV